MYLDRRLILEKLYTYLFDNKIGLRPYHLRKEINILYNYKRELYEDIYRISQENKKRDDQWNRLKDDTTVVNSIIELIALWLSKNLSEEDRNKYFKNILEDINHEDTDSIISSINRIKSNYSDLYKLNPDFLEKLRSAATKNNNLNTANSTTSNNSYGSSKQTSNSNSSNIGCGTIIICAIIGGFIAHAPGFIIGAFIGFYILFKT